MTKINLKKPINELYHEDTLVHFGILGMRWGVRKAEDNKPKSKKVKGSFLKKIYKFSKEKIEQKIITTIGFALGMAFADLVINKGENIVKPNLKTAKDSIFSVSSKGIKAVKDLGQFSKKYYEEVIKKYNIPKDLNVNELLNKIKGI